MLVTVVRSSGTAVVEVLDGMGRGQRPAPRRIRSRVDMGLTRNRRQLVRRLGLRPTIAGRVRTVLDRVIGEAEQRSPGAVAVLDAGCGRKSPLVAFRPRIARLVGVDIHAPDPTLPWLDAFATLDVCDQDAQVPDESFDVILSNFTLEHFAQPATALANFHRWLRPGGTLVVTTVNRRHPFVAAYLNLPDRPRRWLQPVLKASAADAHPLVGACNDPVTISRGLAAAGFVDVQLETVPNLARAWGRHGATFALGLAGDLLTQSMPGRRSTVLGVARRAHT